MSFKVTPSNDRVLCVYAPSGYSTREQLARGRFFEGIQKYMENKNEENENKYFTDAVPIMPYQNSSLIMGLRIYREGITQISLSSPATIGPLARIQDRHGLL